MNCEYNALLLDFSCFFRVKIFKHLVMDIFQKTNPFLVVVLGLATMFLSNRASAQSVSINEESPIPQMMELYINSNKTVAVYDGWRIQLVATTDRRKIDEVQNNFRNKYPISVDWIQAKPYYKVRAGAFINKTDATRWLKTVKADFPDAYLVQDRVKATEITSN